MTLKQLKKYKPPLTKKADFDIFWERTKRESTRQPLNIRLEKINYPIKKISAYKIFFDGFNGGRICAHFVTEKNARNNPTIMGLHGLPGRKGMVAEFISWALSGYNCLSIDVRGQLGESTDTAKYSSGTEYGIAIKGILNKEEYYFRNVYMDCIRAIDFLCTRPEVDKKRIAVTGISQGGGLAIATCALDPRPKLLLPDQPYLCNFKQLIGTAIVNAVRNFREFLKDNKSKEEQMFDTLSYFDCMNLADKVKVKTLMSVGLKDVNCPPITTFAAYNHMKCKKEMAIYKEGTHEWQWYHVERKLAWIVKNL